MESGEVALVIVGIGIVCFLGFLAYLSLAQQNGGGITEFVRDANGNITQIIER